MAAHLMCVLDVSKPVVKVKAVHVTGSKCVTTGGGSAYTEMIAFPGTRQSSFAEDEEQLLRAIYSMPTHYGWIAAYIEANMFQKFMKLLGEELGIDMELSESDRWDFYQWRALVQKGLNPADYPLNNEKIFKSNEYLPEE